MSNRGSSRGGAGPSTHRFQDRRQERMRGAGTQVAIQRDFQFKLPPATRPTAPAASTPSVPRKRGRPSNAEKARRASLSNDAVSPASTSVGVARRAARPPISSTPAASRTLTQPRRSPLFRGPNSLDDEGSQIGDEDDQMPLDDEPFVQHDDEWNGSIPQVDTSLPMIPSPSTPGLRAVPRTRPSLAASSVGNLSLGDNDEYRDSPSSRAADRNLDARKRKRQSSPGAPRPRKPAAPKKAAKPRQPKAARAVLSVPVDYDEDDSLQDRTIMEQRAGNTSRRVAGDTSRRFSAVQGREMQKRLKRALSLVFSPEDAAELPHADDSTNTVVAKKRKSRKYLNDVDVLWSFVDDELRVAIEEQPAKAPFLALKALRKSVRANFLALSEKTDGRTTLISHLVRARKHKRDLRKQVFATRSELSKLTLLAHDRQQELDAWKHEVNVSPFSRGILSAKY